jgi:hypothetical protein
VHPRTHKQTNSGLLSAVTYARARSHCCLRDWCRGRRPNLSDYYCLCIRCASSIPEIVIDALANDLKPNID